MIDRAVNNNNNLSFLKRKKSERVGLSVCRRVVDVHTLHFSKKKQKEKKMKKWRVTNPTQQVNL